MSTPNLARAAEVHAAYRLTGEFTFRSGQVSHEYFDMRRLGAQLDTVVCAIDRHQGGADNLEAEGIQLFAALTRFDLDAVVAR